MRNSNLTEPVELCQQDYYTDLSETEHSIMQRKLIICGK